MNSLASILGALYVLSEMGLSILKRAHSETSRLADRGSLLLIWIVITCSVYLAFSLSVALPNLSLGALIGPARVLGALLFLGGLAIRWYAIMYLGRFFTVNVAIAADHELIDGGPYARVRHPSYSGALMAFVGLGLCLGNWLSIAVATLPIFLVFLWRMRIEEAALLQGLGSQYQDYMDRTKRLIPDVY
jgi:protein-S-isoprenylcysteine O-methyltransferase